MGQLDFFQEPELEAKAKQSLRPYQERIVQEAISALGLGKSPLIEAATGTGKTRIGAEIVRRMAGHRFLWLAHRTELLRQGAGQLAAVTAEYVGSESPDVHSAGERIVVASKDTIRRPKRLERLQQGKPFDVIVIDEAHHAAASSYQEILDAFPNSLRVGLSATPDRFDSRKLHCFDTVTTPYRIVDAIGDSWLVPFLAKRVKVEAVDISGVGVRAGDFAPGELELVMKSEEALHGCAKGLFEYAGARPTICFVSGVDSASRLCEVLNRYRSLCARFVTGATDAAVRQSLFRDFGSSYQFLLNVAVATEGTDLPAAACIAMMRPTRSRGLYVQMLGRGGRPLPGLEGADVRTRADWIRLSGKPNCLVLDFVGNTGKHSVITPFDVAGADSVVAKKAAKRYQEGEIVDVFEALKQEEAREAPARERRKAKAEKAAADRQKLIASVRLSVSDAQLIGLSGLPKLLAEEPDSVGAESLTPGQASELVRLGVSAELGGNVPTKAEARKLILDRRQVLGLATDKQLDLVRRYRPDLATATLTKQQAKGIILTWLRKWKS